MTYKEAITKINKLLGLYKFQSYKIKENGNEIITEGDLKVGEPIYIINKDGQIPAPDGEFELEDTTKITIKDGMVQEIKYDYMEKQQKFVEAMLKDGTVVKSPTFDVGEDVMVVSPDGKEQPAPDGEHELKLKDTEGKEVLIKIITKDGKITERENVELPTEEEKEVEEDMGMLTPGLSIGNDTMEGFKKEVMGVLGEIKDKIDTIVADQEEMKKKVSKFAKEPAGEPLKMAKNQIQTELHIQERDYISQLVKIRQGYQK
jgi:major membrane immunogen (membrane-anchored lipoprotein)